MGANAGLKNSEMEGSIVEQHKDDGCLEDFFDRYRSLMGRV